MITGIGSHKLLLQSVFVVDVQEYPQEREVGEVEVSGSTLRVHSILSG